MTTKYNNKEVDRFWSKRLKSTNPLSAVLTYNAPECLNHIYDQWERQSLLAAIDNDLDGKNCLDLACGIGRISLTLAAQGANVTSVDISQTMLDHLNDKAKSQKLNSNITTIKSPAHELKLPPNSFDLITCFGLLEHLPSDIRQRSLKLALKLLKPKSRMYLVINNSDCLFLKKKNRADKQVKGYHNFLVGIKWLEKLCQKNNFKYKIISANPNYAYLHYHQLPFQEILFPTDSSLKHQAELALKLDMLDTLPDDLRNKMASHYLVELKAG